MIARRSPLKRSTKPIARRARIRTRRPAGTVRREAKAAGYVDPIQWAAVLDFYRDESGVVRCAYCGYLPAGQQDHVKPLSKGGTHTIGNVVPVDAICNLRKGQRTWTVPKPHPWMREAA